MRKIFSGLMAFMLLLMLTACQSPKQNTQDTMVIKPSEFSEETKQVLKLLDEEIMFFDFIVDKTVKSSILTVWIYEDGKWIDKWVSSGNIDNTDNQMAIQITENGYNISTMDKTGYIKYSAPEMDTGLENTTQQLSDKLTNPTNIIVGEEIPLWVKVGNNGNGISSSYDFRNSNCTAGIAFTITFLSSSERFIGTRYIDVLSHY